LVDRHESLRTRFAERAGEPVQVIEPELRVELVPQDATDEAADGAAGPGTDARRERILAALEREWAAPFDLARGPVLRLSLLRLGPDDHVLLRTFHHIVSDAWSEGVFRRELLQLYAAYRAGRGDPLAPLEVQYADFSLWQRAWLDEAALRPGVEYWREQLRA